MTTADLVLYVLRDDRSEASEAALRAVESSLDALNRHGVQVTILGLTPAAVKRNADVRDELELFGVETLPALVEPGDGGGDGGAVIAEKASEIKAALEDIVLELERAAAPKRDPPAGLAGHHEYISARIGTAGDNEDEDLNDETIDNKKIQAKMREYNMMRKHVGLPPAGGAKQKARKAPRGGTDSEEARPSAPARARVPRGVQVHEGPTDKGMHNALERAKAKGLSGDDAAMTSIWLANQEITT